MAKLLLLRGISGSGKSTWAESYRDDNPGWAIVSRDLIRKSGVSDENLITKIEDSTIENMLALQHNVIVDDTNVMQRYINRLAKIGYRMKAEVMIRQFDVDVEDAIARVQSRAAAGGHFVPEAVIRSQHKRIQKAVTLPRQFKPTRIMLDPSKPLAVICDIDGTLAHMNNLRGPYEWDKVGLDVIDEELRDLVCAIHSTGRYRVVLMSGRDEVCRAETEEWLLKNDVKYDELHMRKQDDLRPDEEVKHELFINEVYPRLNVTVVFDDRDKVVHLWREMGLKCYQVNYGNF